MRLLFLLVILFLGTTSLAQKQSASDSIEAPIFDTTQIEIQSRNAFPFCSMNFKILDNCDGDIQKACCRFSAQVFKGENPPARGQIDCNSGMNFSWNYFPSAESAEFNCKNIKEQYEKQSKGFIETEIKCTLYNTQVKGYKIITWSDEKHKQYTIMAYGVINGHHILVELRSMKEVNSNIDIMSTILQVFRLRS